MTQLPVDRPTALSADGLVVMRDVNKHFGALHVLKDINLSVAPGEVVVVLGPSGSGKSTLCRTINRLETIDSGQILIDGKPLPEEGKDLAKLRAEVGMVFQGFNLFAHKTILENVTLGPIKVRKVPADEARKRGLELLKRVGVDTQADKYPAQLSGGQQQRVAIARALVGPRRLVLADEPTGALDSHTGEAVMRVLRQRIDAGAAGLLVTHDPRFAAWADRTVFLRDGVIVDADRDDDPRDLLVGVARRAPGLDHLDD